MKHFKIKIKEALIALSQVNDMPIPQKLYEIKTLVREEKWEDKVWVLKIKENYIKLLNGQKINIDMDIYKDFKKIENESIKYRNYYYFKDMSWQIAVAVFFHDKNFQIDLHDFYKKEVERSRRELNIDNKKTNYGNISYFQIENYKCDNAKESLFRPFYSDWKLKWKEFIERISNLNYKNVFVLKIDFIDSYANLNIDSINFQKGNVLEKIAHIARNYKFNGERIKGVPYGGNVESHMLANYLILEKIVKIGKKINESNMLKVIDIISYADDSCIIVKNKDEISRGKAELIFNDVIKSLKDLKIHALSSEDKTKTFLFDIKGKKDYEEVRDSYTSLSSINAIFLASQLNDYKFDLDNNIEEGIGSKSEMRFNRKIKINKINNYLDISEIISSFDSIIDYVNDPKNINYYLTHIFLKFNRFHELDNIINMYIKNITNFEWSGQGILIEIDDKKKLEKYNYIFTELLKVIINLISYNEIETVRKLISIISQIINSELFEMKKTSLSSTNNLILKTINTIKEYYYISQGDSQKALAFSFRNDKHVLKFIADNHKSSKANQILSDHIINISKMIECDYLNINVKFLVKNSSDNHRDYWGYTKKAFSFIFSKIFEEKNTLLYWRYNRLLHDSISRVDYINNIAYLSQDLDKIADINDLMISDNDKKIFRLITLTPESLARESQWIKDTDKLILVRQLTKLLWLNGSPSTHSFTTHDHNHGDQLLFRFHEFKSIKSIRKKFTRNNILIFPLIASFYIHDLGMLINVDKDRHYNGSIREISENIASTIRFNHGVKSAEILVTKIASLLNIDESWITPIQLSSIAHQKSVDELKFGSKNIENNAIILSILDLMDITFERSSIISRLLTGDISSQTSINHWHKHYMTKELRLSYKNVLTLTITLNRKIINWYTKNNNDKNGDFIKEKIQNFIKKDIKEYLPNLLKKISTNIGFDIPEKPFNINFEYESWPQNHLYGFYQGENKGLNFIEENKLT